MEPTPLGNKLGIATVVCLIAAFALTAFVVGRAGLGRW
jgi:hypothetical protein